MEVNGERRKASKMKYGIWNIIRGYRTWKQRGKEKKGQQETYMGLGGAGEDCEQKESLKNKAHNKKLYFVR